jgi:hypothetical protein
MFVFFRLLMYMFKYLFIIAVSIALIFTTQNQCVNASERQRKITFEGTLLSYSPRLNIACGVLYIHQLAKYRVNKVLKGKYPDNEIVVDHPACDGDVFKDIPIGSRVKITVIVKRKYNVITKHHGIREDWPKIFYIAETPLNILK